MAASTTDARDLPRNVLMVLFILALTAGCIWVLRPFVVVIICGATVAISTWPMLLSVERKLGGRRWAAAGLMIGAMLVAILVPVYFGVLAAVQSTSNAIDWLRDLSNHTLPPLPAWLANLPVVGARAQRAWADVAAGGTAGLAARLEANGGEVLRAAAGRIGNLVGMLMQVLIALAITALLYARGESFASAMMSFSRRLGGERGERSARLAAMATRGVALGVVLTPLIQAILAGIGMAVAGVSHVGILAILVLVTCLAQAGPIPAMLIPVAIMFARGATLPAILLLVWAIVVHISGPIVRPILIKRGVDLPLTLILAGVIGGVSAFGVIGLFIGPVLLAVGAALLKNWVAEDPAAAVTGE